MKADDRSPPATTGDDDVLLEVEDLKHALPDPQGIVFQRQVGDVQAVDGVSFSHAQGRDPRPGGRESGCGKTHDRPRDPARCTGRPPARSRFEGTRRLAHAKGERAPASCAAQMQMIFQDPYASLNPRMTVGDIVGRAAGDPQARQGQRRGATGSASCCGWWGSTPTSPTATPTSSAAGSGSASASPGPSRWSPSSSSATSRSPRWTSRSRPRSSTCSRTCRRRSGLTYLFIAHDLSVVRHISDRVAVMYLGKIVELADREDLYQAPAAPLHEGAAVRGAGARPRGRGEAAADHPEGRRAQSREPARGLPLPPAVQVREENCAVDEPEFIEVEPDHWVACHYWDVIP